MAHYRIVRDAYCGFEVQIWRWWLPFWVQADFSNTHCTLEEAAEFAEQHARPVVWYLGSSRDLAATRTASGGE